MATPSPTPHPPSDQNAGVLDRDDLAASMYHQFRRPLLSFVLTLTDGDRLWAEDVVQETLIRAWRNAEKLGRQPDTIRGWLYTVARRIVIDGWRSKRSRPQEVKEPDDDIAQVPDTSDQTLTAIVIYEALTELRPEHRDALLETYLNDRTVNEAAAMLGIPPGTVKSRIHHAVRALRQTLNVRG